MDEHTVERTDEGDAIVLKTDAYRLAITNDNFAFLTDINTGPGAGCTCHLRETWDIDDLMALLIEAKKVLTERETTVEEKPQEIEWEPDVDEGAEVAILAHYDDEDDPELQIAVIGTITKDTEGGWNYVTHGNPNTYISEQEIIDHHRQIRSEAEQ